MPDRSPPSEAEAAPSAVFRDAPRLPQVARAVRLCATRGVFRVQAGAVDLFALPPGGAQEAWRPIGRIDAGAFLAGLAPAGEGRTEILAVPVPGTLVVDAGPQDGATPHAGFDAFLTLILDAAAPALRPRDLAGLKAVAAEGLLPAGAAVSADRGLVWISASEPVRLVDEEEVPAGQPLALTSALFVRCARPTRLRTARTADLAAAGRLEEALQPVIGLALDRLAARMAEDGAAQAARAEARHAAADLRVREAARLLASPLNPDIAAPRPGEADDPLLQACLRVMAHEKIPYGTLPGDADLRRTSREAAAGFSGAVGAIARRARIRARRARLYDGWWRGDFGSFVALRAGTPVAVLRMKHAYRLIGADGQSEPLDTATAAQLDPEVYVFYRPFPEARLTGPSLVRFAVSSDPGALAVILLAAAAAAVLGLITPAVSAAIFDIIVPTADYPALKTVTLVLAGAAIGSLGFAIAQALSQLRLQGRVDAVVQAAVWDRLLSLPPAFFRRFEVGDLASRAGGINALSSQLTGALLSSLFGGVFATASFAMMVYYQWQLALVGLAFVLVILGGSVGFAVLQRQYQREQLALGGALASRTFQYISGIAKLRTAAAEPFAFWDWSRRFARAAALQARAGRIVYGQSLFSSALMRTFQGVAFAMFAFVLARISIGGFIAFNAAFGQFYSGLSGFAGALVTLYGLAPLFERTRPILDAVPESGGAKVDPGELSGAIRVDGVSFSYPEAGRPVLEDVSFALEPGTFVAIVGPSGAGKSTLLRLLLGFESPARGLVTYDGRDLSSIDPSALRRQLGVVLQNGMLLPGTIFDNITANGPFGLEEAWTAASLAGLADDIRAMPMGMQTLVSEGAATFSGGQKQRLLIARALIRRPRILFFDEATSALDNAAQAHVTSALARLRTTRLVIAHRLSTVMAADRILVLDRGRIVEAGRYADLIAADGPFAALARRQIA